jgi:hypothetical protein
MKLFVIRIFSFLFLAALLNSCAPTRAVLPLCYKENTISASLGGPMIQYGKIITPVPYTTITYSRGITDSTTVFASIHPTAALYGNLQMEIGLNKYLVNNDSAKYAVTVAPTLNILIRDSLRRVYPQIDFNFIKRNPMNENYYYGGICNWFEPATRKINGEKQSNIWFPSPQVGYVWNTKKGLMFQAEVKYLVPFRRNDTGPVDYIKPIIPYGGIGIYFGASYKF